MQDQLVDQTLLARGRSAGATDGPCTAARSVAWSEPSSGRWCSATAPAMLTCSPTADRCRRLRHGNSEGPRTHHRPNSGLGFAVAQVLASSGTYHVLIGARTPARAEAAIGQMLEDSAFPVVATAVSPVTLDLASDTSIAAAAQSVSERFGSLDILINSAGVSTGGSDLSLRDEFQCVFETNVFGAAVLIDTFLPLLRASRYHDRRIVNVTSGAGQIGLTVGPDDRYNARGIPSLPTAAARPRST